MNAHVLWRTLLGAALVAASGCADVEDLGDDTSFRSSQLISSLDFEVHEGPTTQAEGCLAWSIRFGDITRAPMNSSAPPTQVVLFDEFGMESTTTTESCSFVGNQLVDPSGEVVLTELYGDVFAGDVLWPDCDAHLYRFRGPHVFEDKNGPPLLTATLNLRTADPRVRLLVAALTEGVCGGDGLVPHVHPQ